MECLTVDAFSESQRGSETKQAILIACRVRLVDELARSLEFEPMKKSCLNQARVRNCEGQLEKASLVDIIKECLDARKEMGRITEDSILDPWSEGSKKERVDTGVTKIIVRR